MYMKRKCFALTCEKLQTTRYLAGQQHILPSAGPQTTSSNYGRVYGIVNDCGN